MKIKRWHENNLRAVVNAGVFALAVASAGSVFGQVPSATVEIDENCNGTGAIPIADVTFPLACAFLADLGPGGLPNVLTYLTPFGTTLGDLLLTDASEGGFVLDVIRFNEGGSIVFYSDNLGGFDALADTASPPGALYPNNLTIPEVGPEENNGATYTPTAGQPGFDSRFALTYIIHSDRTVPEPATLALLGIGIAGLGFARRKRR